MLSLSQSLRISGCAALIAIFFCATAAAQEPATGITDPPLPDGTQSATQRIAGLKYPAGLSVSLFAAEPQLASPVAIGLDEKGRVFVAEEYRFNRGTEENRTRPFFLEDDLQLKTTADRMAMYKKFASKFDGGMAWFSKYTDQVRLVEDKDGDGRADRSTVFAAGFNDPLDGLAAGVIARDGDIYLTNLPKLWRLRDEDGDGVAEKREALLDGFGVNAGFLGHDLHGLAWGPDGRLYFSVGDRGFHVQTKEGRTLSLPRRGAVFRCWPDGSELEVVHIGLRNPQELAFDEHGNLFTADNNCDKGDHSRLVWIVPGGDSGWNMAYQTIPAPYETGPWHAEHIWHLDDPHDNLRPAWTLPPLGKLGAGPSGFAYNATICLPDAFRGRFFLCNYTGNGGIETFRIQPKGASFELVDPQDFLKPMSITDCDFGYDGKLYLSDFVGLDWNGATRGGRIYTVYDKQQIESGSIADLAKLFREGFAHRENDELAELLKHADMRVRLRAQWALAERGEKAVGVFVAVSGPPLRGRPAAQSEATPADQSGRGATDHIPRLHAIWGLGQIGRILPNILGHLVPLLTDSDPEIRTQAAKTLGDARYAPAGEKLLPLLKDENPRVQFHAAIAMGQLKHQSAVDPLTELLKLNANHDKYLRHAAVFALADIGDKNAVQKLATDPNAAVRLAALLVMRKWQDVGITRFLQDEDIWIVTEAARAINDLPLDGATASLAALARPSGYPPLHRDIPEALGRRVINANFRLGGPAMDRIIAMALYEKYSTTIRREALNALLDWQNPPQRDRVTGNWRPLPGRDVEPLRQALQPRIEFLLAANSRDLAANVLNLIAKLELKTDPAVLTGYLRKKEHPLPTRIAALDALAVLKSPELPKLVEEVLTENLPDMRAAALRVIARTDRERALPLVAAVATGESMTGGTRPTAAEQQQAIALLGAALGVDPLPIPNAVLEQIAQDKLPMAMRLDWLEVLSQRKESAYAKALSDWQARLGPSNSPERQQMALIGGDAARGKEIFFGNRQVQCSRCHKAEGRGGDAGPDLARLAYRKVSPDELPQHLRCDDADQRLRAHLLTSMVFPDHKLAPGFGSITVRLFDGRVLAGLVKAESAEELQLQTPDGQTLRIPIDDIEARTQPKSPMPAMDKVLSLRELRDLVEFLAGLR